MALSRDPIDRVIRLIPKYTGYAIVASDAEEIRPLLEALVRTVVSAKGDN